MRHKKNHGSPNAPGAPSPLKRWQHAPRAETSFCAEFPTRAGVVISTNETEAGARGYKWEQRLQLGSRELQLGLVLQPREKGLELESRELNLGLQLQARKVGARTGVSLAGTKAGAVASGSGAEAGDRGLEPPRGRLGWLELPRHRYM